MKTFFSRLTLVIFFFLFFAQPTYAADFYYIENGACVKTQQNPNTTYWETEAECKSALSTASPTGTAIAESVPYGYKVNDLNVYTDSDKVAEMYENPETRINGNTFSVWVTLLGLEAGKEYWICKVDNLKLCAAHNSNKMKANDKGEIIVNVCAAGKNSLKGVQVNAYKETDQNGGKLGEKCKEGRDYFHEGQTYHISAYDSLGDADINKNIDKGIPFVNLSLAAPVQAEFYVAHSYPLVRMNSLNALKNEIEVTLWGRRPGDGNANNYQVVLEGVDHKYKKAQCYQLPYKKTSEINNDTVGINTQWVTNDHTPPHNEHIFNGIGYSVPNRAEGLGQKLTFGSSDNKTRLTIGRGTYVLKVNERVSDNRPLGIGNNCEGGHTYMHIYFRVGEVKDTTNNIEILKVEYDPNKSDGEKISEVIPNPKVPCAEGGLDPDTEICSVFNVGFFGKVPLEPYAFINRIYTVILSIAGALAVIIIIRAGYKIMMARGDKEAFADARSQITSAIIGLIFIVFAYVILSIITVDILKLPGFSL